MVLVFDIFYYDVRRHHGGRVHGISRFYALNDHALKILEIDPYLYIKSLTYAKY